MTFATSKTIKSIVLAGCATSALILSGAASAQAAEQHEFEIAPQDLGDALAEFSVQGDAEVYWLKEDVAGKRTDGVSGSYTNRQAIEKLLDDAGVEYRIDENGTLLVGEAYIQRASLGEETPPAPFRVAQVDQEEGVQGVDGRKEEDEEARQDVIVVTGTNIRGQSNPTQPVLSFSAEEIQLSGVTTVDDFARTIPQNFSGSVNSQGFATATDNPFNDDGNTSLFSAGFDLRGLGPGATLTLLNGRRISETGEGATVDISQLPLSVVERVEILTDGASAVYGSDAVAGVVNFVLKDDFEGLETRAQYGSVTDGNREEYQLGATGGFNWSSGNFIASVDYLDRTALFHRDRHFIQDFSNEDVSLIPAEQVLSLFTTVSQSLTDNLSISSTAMFTNREIEHLSGVDNGFFEIVNDFNAEQTSLVVNTDVNWEISESWSATAFFDYSKSEIERRSSIVEPAFLVGLADTDFIFEGEAYTIEGLVQGELFNLPGGLVETAFGVQYRNNELTSLSRTTDTLRPGEREIFAVYGELLLPIVGDANQLPLVQSLELSLAGRYDDYNDFGDTFNPKIGAFWKLSDSLAFRGTYSSAFRAPPLSELNGAQRAQANGVIPDPQNLVPNDPVPPLLPGNAYVISLTGGNPDLQEETADAWSLGVVWNPLGLSGLNMELGYFDVAYDNRIQNPGSVLDVFILDELRPFVTIDGVDGDIDASVQAVLNDPNFAFTNRVGFPVVPSDVQALADLRSQNVSTLDLAGIDLLAAYSFETDIGDFSASLNGSYLTKRDLQIVEGAEVIDSLDLIFRPIDLTLRGALSWQNGGFSAFTAINYVDGYEDDRELAGPGTGNVEVDAWATVDLQLAYETQSVDGLLSGTRISVNVSNLFDEDPPFVQPTGFVNASYDAANSSPIGRFVSFQWTKQW